MTPWAHRSKLQHYATKALRLYAADIHNGAKLWPEVQCIERRFNLQGFTIGQVELLDDTQAARKATALLKHLDRPHDFEETDPMHRHSAICKLNDLLRARGSSWLQRHTH